MTAWRISDPGQNTTLMRVPMRSWMDGLRRGSSFKWLFLGSCVGIICGLVGIAFAVCIDLVSHYVLKDLVGMQTSYPAGEPVLFEEASASVFRPWLLPFVLGIGGLISGILVYAVSPLARGAGNEAAIHAYHHQRGRIPLKASIAKFFASIITLGSGGSAGKEGPIALVGAGFGSWFASRLHLSGRDRRILLAAGVGGGIAALFRAPLAGALFSAEVLYSDSEMEADAIIPSFISAITGFVVYGLVEGVVYNFSGMTTIAGGSVFNSLFETPDGLGFTIADTPHLVGFLLLSVAITIAVRFHITVIRGGERLANRPGPIPSWLWPAIGGVAAGCIGLLLWWIVQSAQFGNEQLGSGSIFHVFGTGYGIVQDAMRLDENAPVWSVIALLLIVAIGKIFTTMCSVSSGGSGGLFAPSLVVGGCIGGAVGLALQATPIAPPVAVCVIMGMAGFFTAAYRTPIAALLMVSEFTGNYQLLLPSMWVCSLCFLLGGRGMLSTQVPSPVHSGAHLGHFFNDILAGIRVEQVFDAEKECRTLKPSSSIDDCKQLVTETHQTVYPVVEADGTLVGIFNMNDLRSFLFDETLGLVAVADDVATHDIITLRMRDNLSSAMRRFTVRNLEELPVIEERDGKAIFLGLLTRRQVIAHYNQVVDTMRERREEDGYDAVGTL